MQRREGIIHFFFIPSTGAFCSRNNKDFYLKVLGWLIPFKFSLSLCRLEWGLTMPWGRGSRDPKYFPALRKHAQIIVSKGRLTPLWIEVKCMHKKPGKGLSVPPWGACKVFLGRKKWPHFPFRFISQARERHLGLPKPSMKCSENL